MSPPTRAGASAWLAACALTASASAQQTCHTVQVPAATTNWATTVAIPKFDPAQDVLLGIEITLAGQATGSAKFESLDAASSTVTMNYQEMLALRRPDNSVIVVTIPQQMFVDDVAAFDGSVDFRGTSGKTYPNVVANDSDTVQSPPPASDLALFTGPAGNPGVIVLPISAFGTSSGSGPGNLILQFAQMAEATVTVCYTHAPDCNHNGVPDAQDISNGTSVDVDGNGLPDECDPVIIRYCPGDGVANGGPPCPCGNEVPAGPIPVGCINSTGIGAQLDASGNPSVSNDTLVLSAGQMPPSIPGYFFQGTNATAGGQGTPIFGSAGLNCISGTIIRMAKIVSSPQFGVVTLPFGGDPPLSQQFLLQPGDVRYYQVYYRNSGGPCGAPFNTSNGVRILWTN